MTDITNLQSIIIGLLQGITELFPISSLGHSVLVPAWIGGSWSQMVSQVDAASSETSQYLAFIVALHVATAIALVVFYRKDWAAIIRAFFTTVKTRKIETSTERLAWLVIAATIPVGITGLALEHTFRTLFAKPLAAAVFLTINGLILLGGERLRRKAEDRGDTHAAREGLAHAAEHELEEVVYGGPDRKLATLSFREAGLIGLFQTFALFAGISRSGITMVGGLVRGLDHEDAAKFSFLLATPVILAAGLLKLPGLFGEAGAHIHGQIIVGAIVAGLASYFSVSFLTRYFKSSNLNPFAIYCLIAGIASIIKFA